MTEREYLVVVINIIIKIFQSELSRTQGWLFRYACFLLIYLIHTWVMIPLDIVIWIFLLWWHLK